MNKTVAEIKEMFGVEKEKGEGIEYIITQKIMDEGYENVYNPWHCIGATIMKDIFGLKPKNYSICWIGRNGIIKLSDGTQILVGTKENKHILNVHKDKVKKLTFIALGIVKNMSANNLEWVERWGNMYRTEFDWDMIGEG